MRNSKEQEITTYIYNDYVHVGLQFLRLFLQLRWEIIPTKMGDYSN